MRVLVRFLFFLNVMGVFVILFFLSTNSKRFSALPDPTALDAHGNWIAYGIGEKVVVQRVEDGRLVSEKEIAGVAATGVNSIAFVGEDRLLVTVSNPLTVFDCDLGSGVCGPLDLPWLSDLNGPGQLSFAEDIDRVYLCVSKHNLLFRFDPNAVANGEPMKFLEGLAFPNALDAVTGGVWIADTKQNQVLLMGHDGELKQRLTFPRDGIGFPVDVAMNEKGEGLVLVADAALSNPHLIRVDEQGSVRQRLFAEEKRGLSQIAALDHDFLLVLSDPVSLERVVFNADASEMKGMESGVLGEIQEQHFKGSKLPHLRLFFALVMCFVLGFGLAALDGVLGKNAGLGGRSSADIPWIEPSVYPVRALGLSCLLLGVSAVPLWFAISSENRYFWFVSFSYLMIFSSLFSQAWRGFSVRIGANGGQIHLMLPTGKKIAVEGAELIWWKGMLAYDKWIIPVLNVRGKWLLDGSRFKKEIEPLLAEAQKKPTPALIKARKNAVWFVVLASVVIFFFILALFREWPNGF